MSATSTRPAAARPRNAWRVAAVLALTLALHLWAFDRARRELAFELPPLEETVLQAQLFKMPAPVAVAREASPPPRPRPARAITPPPAAPAPGAAAGIEKSPEPEAPTEPGAAEPEVPTEDAEKPEPEAPSTEATLPEEEEADAPDGAAEAPAGPIGPTADTLLQSAPANAMGQTLYSPLDAVMVSFPRLGRFVSDTRYAKGLLRVLGQTTIEWRIGADRYEATSVTADDSGRTLLTLSSQGGVQPAVGVAPLRYVERRASRAPVAVDFLWDARKVAFSASNAQFPLHDGVQDQLSFMAQLALLAQAFPHRFQPGMPVALEVAGTRNLRVYDLRVVGWEAIRTGTGVIDVLKLERVIAPGARDARIELWLAPDLHWLPARTRTTLANGEEIETVLREVRFE